MQIERDVRREQRVEEVVRVERQRVRVAGERLAAAVREVPVRHLARAQNPRRRAFDRVMRREVVAEKEEAGRGHAERDDGAQNESGCGSPTAHCFDYDPPS
ncbi:MAG: hypothetical protein JOZ54_25630 [Acidobacteria bacterium]|nr:hypothetical protein [Acidobacteriota bacterium]